MNLLTATGRLLHPLRLATALVLGAVASGDEPTLRTTVTLAVFFASVADAQGRPVLGLQAEDFEVLDNGQPRTFTVASSSLGTVPPTVMVLVQTNDFANSALGKIQKIGSMISESVAGFNSSIAMVTYDSRVTLLQDFTQDGDKITAAFRDLPKNQDPDARLLDAVSYATKRLGQRPAGERKCIVILGQDRDRGSETKLKDELDRLQHDGITIYGLHYSAFATAFTTRGRDYEPAANGSYLEGIRAVLNHTKANTLQMLTSTTGGTDVGFATKAKLENELISLGADIHSRYQFAFTPATDTLSSFHEVRITCRSGAGSGSERLVVKSKAGYWSSPR